MKMRCHVGTLAGLLLLTAGSARAHDMPDMPKVTQTLPSVGQTMLAKIQALYGTWDSPATGITDIFTPFALGTAVLGAEWKDGKQLTTTIFYVVDGELRADHFCDYLNQLHYTVQPGVDPVVIDFQFREATNLAVHPVHFHSTQWRMIDAQHMIQDWYVMGGKKPVSLVHMEFTKRAESVPHFDLPKQKTIEGE